MISAEEVRNYQKEQKEKIDVTSDIIEIEKVIKENMLNLSANGIFYAFKKVTFPESLNKIEKVLEDNGYDVGYVSPSHYCEFGGFNIKWGKY